MAKRITSEDKINRFLDERREYYIRIILDQKKPLEKIRELLIDQIDKELKNEVIKISINNFKDLINNRLKYWNEDFEKTIQEKSLGDLDFLQQIRKLKTKKEIKQYLVDKYVIGTDEITIFDYIKEEDIIEMINELGT